MRHLAPLAFLLLVVGLVFGPARPLGIGSAAAAPAPAATPADDKPSVVRDKTLPLFLEIPKTSPSGEWTAKVKPAGAPGYELRVYRKPLPFAELTSWDGLQPDLGKVDPAEYQAMMERGFDESGVQSDFADYNLVKGAVSRREHKLLGPYLDLPYTLTPKKGPPVTFTAHFTAFEIERGMGNLTVVALGDDTASRPVLEEVLDMVRVARARVSGADMLYGKVKVDAGYEVELPEHWRALTAREVDLAQAPLLNSGPHSGKRALQSFVDMRTALQDEPRVFSCNANMVPFEPFEVVAPEASAQFADNYVKRIRALLKGSDYKVTTPTGTVDLKIIVDNHMPHLKDIDDAGATLRMTEQGDRPAYRWSVTGTARYPGDKEPRPVHAETFYVVLEKQTIDCVAIGSPEDKELFDAFGRTMDSLRITDGEKYPMILSARGWYYTNWPWHHPAAQIWWFLLGAVAVALYLLFKPEK